MFHIARAPLFRLHKPQSIRLLLSCNGFSSDSNSPGDGNDKPKTQPAAPARKAEKSEEEGKKSSAALNRLNELLAMMNTDNELKLVKKVDLPRPKAKKSKDKKASDSDSDSDDDERPKDLAQATRKVATALGGDAKRTESELLSKLLGTTSPAAGESNLTDIITGMTVDKSTKKQTTESDPSRSTLVKKSIDSKRAKQRRPAEDGDQAPPKERYERKRFSVKQPPQTPGGPGSVKLFDEEPLGIFTDLASLKESPDKLHTWQKLHERELRLAVTHPPANYFQKMALWTEQGKLWKFPINNEQGREEEAQVAFTEHVFLEEHLEPWCPRKGPIRHFMELVCVGLSKNHYITAQEKRDHIFWFRDYFEQKKEILKDIIVAESSGGSKTKEIEQ
ncbi:28S ribosomal protein S31, mitochondrial [Anopheles maculipalpis]|uniref:28S ribosomal protein S31, mitochondrial n=1 Tax=Anopheles maculipalpis TaxID=1496333 RepID=UPI0021599101|nr:28S ribosomal protein S31, mitochondrial [Anopheles maculipalpis]